MRLEKTLVWIYCATIVLGAVIGGLLLTAKGQKLLFFLVVIFTFTVILPVMSLYERTFDPEAKVVYEKLQVEKARRKYIKSLKGEALDAYKEGCKHPAYIKLGNHIFAIKRENLYSLFRDGESIGGGCDSATRGYPLEVDELSFMVRNFTLPSGGPPYTLQYQLEPHPTHLRDHLTEILDELTAAGQTLSDLPRVGSFYKYKHISTYYVSADRRLADANGHPIVIGDCHPRYSVLKCGLIFDWKPDVRVSVRATGDLQHDLPNPPSMDVWLDVFPIYVDILNEQFVSDQTGKSP